MFENSGKMETVEVWKPVNDASGKYVGLDQETIFYDPETFRIESLRALRISVHEQTVEENFDAARFH